MAKASKEIREELDEVEQKILKDKALLNDGNENFRGFMRLCGLGLGLGLAGATGLGFLTAAFGLGVPILDSLPMFQNKKRFKARLANAKIRDEIALQRYEIARKNERSKFAKKDYNNNVELRRNDPTSETVYEDINMLKNNSEQKSEETQSQAQNNKNNDGQKNQNGQNKQVNINGPVININGENVEQGDLEVNRRIMSEGELNAENNSNNNSRDSEEDNFNKKLIEGMKAIDERISVMRTNLGLDNKKEETESKQKPTVESILEDMKKIDDQELESYLNKKREQERETLKRAYNRAGKKKSGNHRDLDEEQER